MRYHVDAEPAADFRPAARKYARFQYDRRAAAGHQVDHGRFHRAGARTGEHHHVVGRLKHLLQPGEHLGQDRPEFPRPMVNHFAAPWPAGPLRAPGWGRASSVVCEAWRAPGRGPGKAGHCRASLSLWPLALTPSSRRGFAASPARRRSTLGTRCFRSPHAGNVSIHTHSVQEPVSPLLWHDRCDMLGIETVHSTRFRFSREGQP